MKYKKTLFILFHIFCSMSFGQLIIDESRYTIEELVKDVLINSTCAETSNYSSFTGDIGIAYFDSNGENFPFKEGVILSTGNAKTAVGPNDEIYSSGTEEWPGDEDLKQSTRTVNLFNATYIKFDFVPKTNGISFNFLFASEEYSDNYQCLYSDVFAFILTDKNGVSTNLALVPNTLDRVSATTIRPGIRDECPSRNEDSFAFYNGSRSVISFAGQTKSLTARSTVVPGETYSIKLVIADNLDPSLDSAVFLEAGSFSINVSLGEDRTVENGNALCYGEVEELNATALGAISYKWYKDEIYLPELDNQPIINVDQEGFYKVVIQFTPNCASESMVQIEYVEPPIIADEPLDLIACDVDNNNHELFDFDANSALILGNQDQTIYKLSFHRTQEDAENDEKELVKTKPYLGSMLNETIYVRISAGPNCYETTSFNIKIQPINPNYTLENTYTLCLDENQNPIVPLPLLETGLSENEYGFKWYRNFLTDENLILGANGSSYLANERGKYIVVIKNLQYGCEILLETVVKEVEPPSSIEVVHLSDLFSSNNIVEVVVESKGDYEIALDEGTFGNENRFEMLNAGEHVVYVKDIEGCTIQSKDFLIVDYPRFFSPNGDGINDIWNIAGISQIQDVEIKIFDRYGKLLYQVLGDIGWDGTSGGGSLPSSDYWFSIAYTQNGNKKEFKNHFTLKR